MVVVAKLDPPAGLLSVYYIPFFVLIFALGAFFSVIYIFHFQVNSGRWLPSPYQFCDKPGFCRLGLGPSVSVGASVVALMNRFLISFC